MRWATGLAALTVSTNAANTCDQTSFPTSWDDTVFMGLHQAQGVETADQCQQACCNEGPSCGVWQWADSLPAAPVGTCWIGPAGLPSKPQRGWVSRGNDKKPEIPKPSPAQLTWMSDEIGAIGHFNMGTYQACGIGSELFEGHHNLEQPFLSVPPPETFAPTNVDVEAWVKGLTSFGAKHAVLVVSHGCGFNTFPTKTAFPEFDFEYNYTVAQSPWKAGKGDIAAEFVAACRAHGIRPGFYYGSVNNAFLNVRKGLVADGRACEWCPDITQDQYTQILLANLRQLWTDYGELAEVWFDGGLPQGTADKLAALLEELQPNAVAFQGPGKNAIRWCGTESGHVKYPFWSTADSSMSAGAGSANGAAFVPAEADTCFQTGKGQENLGAEGPYGGCWFYNPSMVPKSLSELVSSYHDSVGRNAFMLLDWTPMPDGTMHEDHLNRYEEFGDWLRGCYSAPVVSTKDASGGSVKLTIPQGLQVDRIVLAENLTRGERVQSYTVMLDGETIATGSSVGYKRIQLFDQYHAGSELLVSFEGDAAALATVAAFNCSRTPEPQGCSFVESFKYKVVDEITLDTQPNSNPQACCAACKSTSGCAVFVLDTEKTCTLLSANQGGDSQDGFLSGSPRGGSLERAFVV